MKEEEKKEEKWYKDLSPILERYEENGVEENDG